MRAVAYSLSQTQNQIASSRLNERNRLIFPRNDIVAGTRLKSRSLRVNKVNAAICFLVRDVPC